MMKLVMAQRYLLLVVLWMRCTDIVPRAAWGMGTRLVYVGRYCCKGPVGGSNKSHTWNQVVALLLLAVYFSAFFSVMCVNYASC